MTAFDEDDELTELYDADVPRVDLVDKAANGISRFLIAKREDGTGLLDADFVRELIGKSEPEPEPVGETVTMTGSPAAIAKLIHGAPIRRSVQIEPTYEQVVKAKYNADDRKRMAGNGQAMKDGSYPIADREDLDNAIPAVGRGGAEHNAIRRHVISRAKSLGASSEIPDNWNSDGSLKEGPVSKMELDETADGMDPTVALAAPDGEAPGDPMDPGSPAWEAIDAATAAKWTSILARAKNAIGVLADREMLEAASADPSDAENAMDLDDACCVIDYAISVLAPFAVAEQSEADCGADAMEALGKALAGFDPAPLATLEAYGQVAKAGRVLSSANEAAIRGAVESLQKVLASLPQAPVAPDESGRPVAKEEMTVPATAPTSTETVEPDGPAQMGTPKDEPAPAARPVEKADGKPAQVAVYDQKGKLVGIVDPGDITPIAGAEAEDDGGADGADGDGQPAAAPATDTTDMTPAPAAEVGIPADAVPDDVTKSTVPDTTAPTTDTTTDAVLKSIVTDAVTAALDAYSATHKEDVAKQAAVIGELAEAVETLKGQVEAYGEQPAPPKVFTNGAVPPPHLLRGQDRGAPPVDVAKALERKRSLYGAADAAEQNRIANDMQQGAIDQLARIHQRRA